MNLNSTAKDNQACRLSFSPKPAPDPSEAIVVGRGASLSTATILAAVAPSAADDATAKSVVGRMLESIKDSGKAATFLPVGGATKKLTLIVLPPPERLSRNNHPFSLHAVTDSLKGCGLDAAARGASVQVAVVDEAAEEFLCPAAAAIARALPRYDAKSSADSKASRKRKIDEVDGDAKMEEKEAGAEAGATVAFFNEKGELVSNEALYRTARAVAEGVRLSARLGDMPPAELNPDSYSAVCEAIAETLVADGADVKFEEKKGEALREGGYGGIYGVGMAARCPPRMIVMTYTPKGVGGKVEHVALCGKGVIYDTGGLSLKPKTGMSGMKHDMGGSAGVLGGFRAAVQLKLPRKITLILAIVENAIGPDAVRNDDILTMKSGKTVEVNNTDAEGRLILADCVSHASNNLEGGPPDVILDMATLTGAQLVTTGKKHAGVLAKTQAIEDRVRRAGMKTGDLVFPMLYVPELLMSEFASKVADMKNSVADRGNAQASCAGHFIESHIDDAYEGDWVHVDMAGPTIKEERATGYGVALVLGLLEAPGFC